MNIRQIFFALLCMSMPLLISCTETSYNNAHNDDPALAQVQMMAEHISHAVCAFADMVEAGKADNKKKVASSFSQLFSHVASVIAHVTHRSFDINSIDMAQNLLSDDALLREWYTLLPPDDAQLAKQLVTHIAHAIINQRSITARV